MNNTISIKTSEIEKVSTPSPDQIEINEVHKFNEKERRELEKLLKLMLAGHKPV